MESNTLFLRLSGPMQSWGTASRFQIRRTGPFPSRSGVMGLLLCAMGIPRAESEKWLGRFQSFQMGVRVDEAGTMMWDYHSAGAGKGIRSAEGDGKIKITEKTKEPETLLSRRQYLMEASFLVALIGEPELVQIGKQALKDPVWPLYLGRKSCIPSVPVFSGTGQFSEMTHALSSLPVDCAPSPHQDPTRRIWTEWIAKPDTPLPETAVQIQDMPKRFGYFGGYAPRWILPGTVPVSFSDPKQTRKTPKTKRPVDYTSPQWRSIRQQRLEYDHHLCVFCKSPAKEVHHVTYERRGEEDILDLRSLCSLCHDACTLIEYGTGMQSYRVDPADPAQRSQILAQITQLLAERKSRRKKEILGSIRETRFLETS